LCALLNQDGGATHNEHGTIRDAQPGVAADRRQALLAGSLVAALLGGG
jgi:hypothetical protein